MDTEMPVFSCACLSETSLGEKPHGGSPISQLVQVFLVHAEVMPDLMEHGGSNLANQVLLAVADQLDVYLEDEDVVRRGRPPPFRLGAAQKARALVDAEQQLVIVH